MITRLQGLLEEIRALEERVSIELAREAEEFGYTIQRGHIQFRREIARHHRALATRVRRYLAESSLLTLATAPFIYSMIFPLLLLDVFAWTYQLVCFTAYGIPRVRRADYIIMDRHRLQYLNWIERLNCLYCGYGNGLLAYVQEIAARTEQYWCPIKHAQRLKTVHSRYYQFLPYGDAEGYSMQLESLRRKFSDLK